VILPYINAPENRVPDLLGGIGDTLVNAAQRKQQEKAAAAKLLMDQQRMRTEEAHMRAEEQRAQAEAARQESYAKRAAQQEEHQRKVEMLQQLPQIEQHLRSGDEGGATALAQVLGSTVQRRALPQAPGEAPGAPQAPVEQGPIPSPEERALSFAGQPGDQAPAAEQAITEDQRMLGERQQYAQALADHPRLVAEHKAHQDAFQQAKQNPVYDIETPYGKSTIDLGAERAQAQQQRQETAGSLSAGLPPQYAMQAAALIRAGVPAVEVSREIAARQKADEERMFKQQMAGQYQTTADQKFQIGMSNAASHRLAAGAAAGAKDDAAAARAQTTLRQALADAKSSVDWKGLVGMDNTSRALLANVNSGNVLQTRDAQIQLGRIFRGTTPTEGEMHLLYNNLGGTTDKWNQFVASLESGGLSPEQQRQLKAASATTVEELNKRKERAFGSLKTQLGPGSGLEMLGPQVNQKVKGLGQAVGVDVPDIYNTDQTGPGAVLLGSKAKKTPGGEKLLVDTAKLSKLAPEDRDMAQKARAAVNDPKSSPDRKKNAQAVLDHLGL